MKKNIGIYMYICMCNVYFKLNNCIVQIFVYIIYKLYSGLKYG